MCPDECMTCTSLSVCTSCSGNRLLQAGNCVLSCSDRFYKSDSNCLSCRSSCARCTGSSQFDCLICETGYIMTAVVNCVACKQFFLKTFLGSNLCLEACPQGTYVSLTAESLRVCNWCEEGCHCTAASNCLSCISGYYEKADSDCEPCQENCLVCTGAITCTKCYPSSYLHQGGCLLLCPAGYYGNDLL